MQGALTFKFETSVEREGLSLRSADLNDFSIWLEKPIQNEAIIEIMTAAMPLYLMQYGLKANRHMIVLDDPQANLQEGGTFTCVIVPRPI